MLLIGAELLRIGKNLYIYITKSEPGANHLGTTRRKKHKNIETASNKTPFQ